jgi:glycerol-3-phosphate dehydrogenase
METIIAGGGAIRAEVVYGVRYEMAATIEDVLARRLGMQFYSWSDCICRGADCRFADDERVAMERRVYPRRDHAIREKDRALAGIGGIVPQTLSIIGGRRIRC